MKKIAVNTVKTFLKDHKGEDTYTQTFDVAGKSFDVVFYTSLSIAEKTTFINRVLSGCFDGMGNFRPEYVAPVRRATILQMCTNLPALTLENELIDDGSQVLDLDAMNDLYAAMDIDLVDDAGFRGLLDEITQLCRQAIEWKKSKILNSHDTDSALRNLLDALTEKVNNVDTDSLMQYASTLSETTKGLDEDGIVGKLIDLQDYRDKINI